MTKLHELKMGAVPPTKKVYFADLEYGELFRFKSSPEEMWYAKVKMFTKDEEYVEGYLTVRDTKYAGNGFLINERSTQQRCRDEEVIRL